MDLDTLLDTLRDEHGINVAELQAKATAGEAATALSNALTDALKNNDVVKLSNDASDYDIVSSVSGLAETNVALSARVETLEKAAAAKAVDQLISDGFILPAKRDVMLELKLTNPALFDQLLPEQPVVKLSNESGFTPDEPKSADMDAEIQRLADMANKNGLARTN